MYVCSSDVPPQQHIVGVCRLIYVTCSTNPMHLNMTVLGIYQGEKILKFLITM